MSETNENMVLYIIMRSDLESLNAGKAMAQAAHAGECMRHRVNRLGNEWRTRYLSWLDQAGKFGTTVVLAAEAPMISRILARAHNGHELACGWVHDPSYPIDDGMVTHTIPLNTCAFLFGDKREAEELTRLLPLYP
jgi:hypothetical protein